MATFTETHNRGEKAQRVVDLLDSVQPDGLLITADVARALTDDAWDVAAQIDAARHHRTYSPLSAATRRAVMALIELRDSHSDRHEVTVTRHQWTCTCGQRTTVAAASIVAVAQSADRHITATTATTADVLASF